MNKKGFTLINLLAIVVVLAVIAIMAMPMISGFFSKTTNTKSVKNADEYVAAVKDVISAKNLGNGRYYIDQLGNLFKDGQNYEVLKNGLKPVSGVLTINNGKVINGVLTIDNSIVEYAPGASVSKKINSSKYYGLEYSFQTKKYTRLGDAVGLKSCVGTNIKTCKNDFDSEEIFRDITEVVDSYGNTFIKIPKFYIKKEMGSSLMRWFVSKEKLDTNYYLPSCFYDFATNKELDYVLVGKYDSALSDDGLRLESKVNKISSVNLSLNQSRSLANANNIDDKTGYQLMDVHTLDAIQTLFYVEEGTCDSQKVMTGFTSGILPWQSSFTSKDNLNGTNTITIEPDQASQFRVSQNIDLSSSIGSVDIAHGRTITKIDANGTITFSGDPVNITTSTIVSNASYLSGSTNSVLASSGSVGSNIDGKHSMNYRGIENLYGNLWQYVDGVVIDNPSDGMGTLYVNNDSSSYTSIAEMNDNYKEVKDYKKLATSGYITKLGYDNEYPFIQLPTDSITTDYDSSSIKDYYYQTHDEKKQIVIVGGYWYEGRRNGISAYLIQYGDDDTNITIGSRLVKKAI